MKQDYFIYKGHKYNAGTIIKIRQYDSIAYRPYETEAIFISCDPQKDKYEFKAKGHTYYYPKSMFDNILLGVTNQLDTSCISVPQEQYNQKNKNPPLEKELNVDGLLIAWIWYIFIMIIATIFNGNIVIWMVVSVVFFRYRNKKLREAGLKK